jgi:hypothetical protein
MTNIHFAQIVGAGLLCLHSTSNLIIKPALDKLGLVKAVSLLLHHKHDVVVGLCQLFNLLYAS